MEKATATGNFFLGNKKRQWQRKSRCFQIPDLNPNLNPFGWTLYVQSGNRPKQVI